MRSQRAPTASCCSARAPKGKQLVFNPSQFHPGVSSLMSEIMRLARLALAIYACAICVECLGERQNRWPIYNDIGPFPRIYPPLENFSINISDCVPEPKRNVTCPIFVLFITSFGGSFSSGGEMVPAVQMALDQINRTPNLLTGYTLHYTLLNSQVSFSLENLFNAKSRHI